MVIDMTRMCNVEVDTSARTVTFEGGCLLADIDAALEPLGLATVVGIVNHTGAAGLILGGGSGYLTAQHGLAIDNLISVQMVLADGSMVEASEVSNPDLFWAVRGAGTQFGVVTRFRSRIHPQGKIWAGMMVFAPDKLPALVDFANEFHTRDQRDGHLLIIVFGYAPPDFTAASILCAPIFNGPEEQGREFFAKLWEASPITAEMGTTTVAAQNGRMNELFEHGSRRLMGGSNVLMPLDAAKLADSAKMFWDFCDAHEGMGHSIVALEFFPTHKIREVPHHATAYANRGEYYGVATSFEWKDEGLDTDVRKFNQKLCDHVQVTNGYQVQKDGPVGRSINMDHYTDKAEEAFGTNISRLAELKTKYDPENAFWKRNGVQPKQD